MDPIESWKDIRIQIIVHHVAKLWHSISNSHTFEFG